MPRQPARWLDFHFCLETRPIGRAANSKFVCAFRRTPSLRSPLLYRPAAWRKSGPAMPGRLPAAPRTCMDEQADRALNVVLMLACVLRLRLPPPGAAAHARERSQTRAVAQLLHGTGRRATRILLAHREAPCLELAGPTRYGL